MSDWRQDAACRGMDPTLFYPSDPTRAAATTALRVCAGCPVQAACRAASSYEVGVWGGLAESERTLDGQARGGCGSAAGYTRHRAKGEAPCAACLEANAAYHRQYRRGARHRSDARELVVATLADLGPASIGDLSARLRWERSRLQPHLYRLMRAGRVESMLSVYARGAFGYEGDAVPQARVYRLTEAKQATA